MGAFDSYVGLVRCPRCNDQHWIEGQTKLFDPDYDTQSYFTVGEPCPKEIDFPRLAAPLVDDQWMRMRDPVSTTHLTLLVDGDDLYACNCELPLAIVLHFELAPATVTLVDIRAFDARDPALPAELDFVDTYWPPDLNAAARRILARHPIAARARQLTHWITRRFEHDDSPLAPRTWLVGPTRCEACGDVRERTESTQLSDDKEPSLFGAGWTGGALFLGTRVPFDEAWLEEDLDHNWYLRARHPVGRDRLVILGHPRAFGCACGAGRATFVSHYARHPGALELVESRGWVLCETRQHELVERR
ncbi:MAG: hypothetical protein WKG01_20770, partial [Kofleriaceae bacterium]